MQDRWVQTLLLPAVLHLALSCPRRPGPPPDRNPPSLRCPAPIIEENDPFQTNAVVWWREPSSAHDPEDGRFHKVTRSGKEPGSVFSEGTTEVYYSSRDSAGNLAKCSLKITVKVVRCKAPRRMNNGFLHCHPSADFVRGGVCSFGCYEGYRLVGGPRTITCESRGGAGRWSGHQPECQRVECLPLSPPTRGHYQCTDSSWFLSACSHHCPPGFSVPPGVPSVRVCSKHGTWRGSPSVCKDSEPPRLQGCGRYVEVVADRGQEAAEVHWTLPSASDNSPEVPSLILHGDLRPRTLARAGTYHVWYTARDSAGNEASPCNITVVVKVLMCPRQFPTPYLQTDCPSGARYGAQCQHSCQGGWALNGSTSSSCERSPTSPAYAYWQWNRGRPFCQKGRLCPDLPAPANGALACDLWFGGEFCQMQCREGTDFPQHLARLKEINVCGSSGSWVHHVPPEPECQAVRRPRGTQVAVGLSFFTGNCFEEATRQQIRENFIRKLNSSLFSDICLNSRCSAGNVEVRCGPVRSKRSTNSTQDENSTHQTTIKFQLLSALGTSGDKMADYQEAAARSNMVLVALETDTDTFLAEVVGSNISIVGSSLQRGFPDLDCAPGSFPSYSELACVECSKGSYHDQANDSCVPCPVGSFQDKSGQSRCEPCPAQHTSLQPGAASLARCLPQCRPGHLSSLGIEPCSPCPRGTLQPEHGATSCLPCPASTATVEEGATHQGACREFDLTFPQGLGASAELQLTRPAAGDRLTLTLWLQGAVETEAALLNFSLGQDELLLSLTEDANMQLRINGEAVADNVTFNSTRWRHVRVELEEGHVTLYVDSQPRLQNVSSPSMGQRSNLSSSEAELRLVLGGRGFWGSVTQLHVWDDDVTLPEPTAAPQCAQTLLGNVLSWRDLLDATTKGAHLQIPSQCDDRDACLSSPCQQGTCSDVIGGFTCTCDEGFTGERCDVNVDDCQGHLCVNGGTCVDGVMNYTCSCLSNYTGAFCDDVIRDGGWGEWGNWSQCSVSCGEGLWHRRRRCDSPLPQNGGLDCQGEAEETAVCNLTVCPECPEVTAPANGSWTCEKNVTLTRCHVGCDAGFDFDLEPMPEYTCGLETGYVWSFQTEENPHRRLPSCMPMAAPKEANVTWRAVYANLTCGQAGAEEQEEVKEQVSAAMATAIRDINCIQGNVCKVAQQTVTDCPVEGSRDRRSLQSAGVLIVLSIQPQTVGGDAALAAMTGALDSLNASAQGDTFTVRLGGHAYPLASDALRIGGQVRCDPGQAMVSYYCVPCGPGSFGAEDYCLLCDVGTFQPLPAQASCLPCPRGWSTPGKGSVNSSECTVSLTSEKIMTVRDNFMIVGATVGCFLGVILVAAIATVVKKALSTKARTEPAMAMGYIVHAHTGPSDVKPRA